MQDYCIALRIADVLKEGRAQDGPDRTASPLAVADRLMI
jgi:hypothetical protein